MQDGRQKYDGLIYDIQKCHFLLFGIKYVELGSGNIFNLKTK
jgi:hypothetical protein